MQIKFVNIIDVMNTYEAMAESGVSNGSIHINKRESLSVKEQDVFIEFISRDKVIIPRQFGDALIAACVKYNKKEETLANKDTF